MDDLVSSNDIWLWRGQTIAYHEEPCIWQLIFQPWMDSEWRFWRKYLLMDSQERASLQWPPYKRFLIEKVTPIGTVSQCTNFHFTTWILTTFHQWMNGSGCFIVITTIFDSQNGMSQCFWPKEIIQDIIINRHQATFTQRVDPWPLWIPPSGELQKEPLGT